MFFPSFPFLETVFAGQSRGKRATSLGGQNPWLDWRQRHIFGKKRTARKWQACARTQKNQPPCQHLKIATKVIS
jgi:hypothetical protein